MLGCIRSHENTEFSVCQVMSEKPFFRSFFTPFSSLNPVCFVDGVETDVLGTTVSTTGIPSAACYSLCSSPSLGLSTGFDISGAKMNTIWWLVTEHKCSAYSPERDMMRWSFH